MDVDISPSSSGADHASSSTPPPPNTSASPTMTVSHSRFSNSAHIRSRITVVCAECKRLKLKCDRRSPCSSCVKRDTVSRCQYSAAAAEKIDVQSLHNRLQLVETQIAQLLATGAVRSAPLPASESNSNSLPFPHNDRSMLATGQSGSSVTMSLDDVAPLWLELLDVAPLAPHPEDDPGSSQAQLQPTAVDLCVHDEPPPYATLPQLKVYYPNNSAAASVTPQLMQLLPGAAALRSRILTAVEDTLRMHPCFNFKHFRARTDIMFAWAKDEEARPATSSKADLARSIFFNQTSKPVPTLSFFSAVCAAHALGVSVIKENESFGESSEEQARKAARAEDGSRASKPVWSKVSASALYALSQQALQQFEQSHAFDLDYLIACILQMLYLLYDGKPRIAHVVYPLVGKMVNIAQMMGLATDPDEFPGKWTLFEAEQRRRVWWDVYYYDVFISDCMGHQPIIQDNTYTTKLPVDVDEGQFTPSSTSYPVPVPRGAGGDPSETGFAFFAQKCRLAQLVKSVKKRTFMDPLTHEGGMERSLVQAEQFEQEVKTWLSELPRPFRLDSDVLVTNRAPVSATLQAQRCELAIVANRMVLKIFMPFLRACVCGDASVQSTPNPRRIVSSIVDAAHAIVHAVQLSQTIWRQTRPAAFAFYSFGRTLFDSLVMAASAVVVHPTGASSGVALADMSAGLVLMKDTRTAFGRSCRESCSGGTVQEAIHIIDRLRARAESARAGEGPLPAPVAALTGSKRKRGQAEEEDDMGLLDGDFELPYVGTGVSCVRSGDGYFTPSSRSQQSDLGGPLQSDTSISSLPLTKTGLKRPESAAEAGPSTIATPPTPSSPKPQISARGRPRTSSNARRSSQPPPPAGSSTHAQPLSSTGHAKASTRPVSQGHTPTDVDVYSSLPDLLISDTREQPLPQHVGDIRFPSTPVAGPPPSQVTMPPPSTLPPTPGVPPTPQGISPAPQALPQTPQSQTVIYEPQATRAHTIPAYQPMPPPPPHHHFSSAGYPYTEYYSMHSYTPAPQLREHEQPYMLSDTSKQHAPWPAAPTPAPAQPPPPPPPPSTQQPSTPQQPPASIEAHHQWSYF